MTAAIQRMASELGITQEHARNFVRAIFTWRGRVGQKVRFEYVSLKGNRTMHEGRVTTISIFGAEPRSQSAFAELDAMCGLTPAQAEQEEQCVVAKVDGKCSCRVWPEDRISNVEVVVPRVHPITPLIQDITFQRCGKDGEMRLKLKNGCFGRRRGVWNFDMDAFSLLYVWPTEPAEVLGMCPRAFPLKKHVAERAVEPASPEELANNAEPECEPPMATSEA